MAAQLMELLNVSSQRATELLEASSSVEQALELHFANTQQHRARVPSKGSSRNVTPQKRKPASATAGQQQKSIASFFGSPPSSAKKTKSEHKAASVRQPQKHAQDERAAVSLLDDASAMPQSQQQQQQQQQASVSTSDAAPTPIEVDAVKAVQTTCPKSQTSSSESSSTQPAPPAVDMAAQSHDEPVTGSTVDCAWSKYRPVSHACWRAPAAPPFAHLSNTFEALTATRSRLKKADILTNCFRSLLALSPETLLPTIFLCCNKVAEQVEGVVTGTGDSQVLDAIIKATGTSKSEVHKQARKHGDLGDAVQACKSRQRLLVQTAPLTIAAVHANLLKLSTLEGQGSKEKRVTLMANMIRACRGGESRYLVRILVRNIRTGATLISVLASLAAAVVLHTAGGCTSTSDGRTLSETSMKPQIAAAQLAVRKSYNLCPHLPTLVNALVEGGVEHMVTVCSQAQVGKPLSYMLAKPQSSVEAVLKVYEDKPFLLEYKYDGQRAQIHVQADGTVTIFSRKLQNMTAQYTDVVDTMQRAMSRPAVEDSDSQGCVEVIIDAEIMAVDPTQGNRILPFQALSSRPRGDKQSGQNGKQQQQQKQQQHSVKAPEADKTSAAQSVSVCVIAYDLLAHEGQTCLELPLEKRRAMLRQVTAGIPAHQFQIATGVICCPPEYPGLAAVRAQAASAKTADIKTTAQQDVKVSEASTVTSTDKLNAVDLDADSESSDETSELMQLITDLGVDVSDDATQEEQIMNFLQDSIAASCEGLMAKSLGSGSTYKPGDRGSSWVKLKKDYINGLCDTFDVVPIGGWWGQGRKASWLSPVLLAVYDPRTGDFQSLCRCMSGFTDAFYKQMLDFYVTQGRTVERCPTNVKTGDPCSVWFKPCEVWEVRGADLTLSPKHAAAEGMIKGSSRGCALRFPRFLKPREDKSIEDATTAAQVADMFRSQAVRLVTAEAGAEQGSDNGEQEDDDEYI